LQQCCKKKIFKKNERDFRIIEGAAAIQVTHGDPEQGLQRVVFFTKNNFETAF
jgi:hypothetical protein